MFEAAVNLTTTLADLLWENILALEQDVPTDQAKLISYLTPYVGRRELFPNFAVEELLPQHTGADNLRFVDSRGRSFKQDTMLQRAGFSTICTQSL